MGQKNEVAPAASQAERASMTIIGIKADREIQLQDGTIITPKMTGQSGLGDVKHQKLGIAQLCEREADQQISN
jgi:hypothetical protein